MGFSCNLSLKPINWLTSYKHLPWRQGIPSNHCRSSWICWTHGKVPMGTDISCKTSDWHLQTWSSSRQISFIVVELFITNIDYPCMYAKCVYIYVVPTPLLRTIKWQSLPCITSSGNNKILCSVGLGGYRIDTYMFIYRYYIYTAIHG